MSKYQIIRWNVVTDCNGIQRPMLYFKPDLSIILQMQNNNNYLYLDIDQCGLYSGNMIPALIDTASQQPNYRPNFFEACHLFCATLLETPWYGFPNLNQSGQFSVYTGVIIPTCWRANGNCPGTLPHPSDPPSPPPSRHSGDDPSRHSGDDPSRHSGDDPSRHSGDDPSRHSGDECSSEDIKTGKCKCMNMNKNSKLDCISGGTTVSDANACKAPTGGDAVYFKDGIAVGEEENCYTCDAVPSIISGEDYKCKWNPVEDFEHQVVQNKNKISTLTPQQPLEKKTSPGCSKKPVDIIPGVPENTQIVDYSSSPVNYASIQVSNSTEEKANAILAAEAKAADVNKMADLENSTLSNVREAQKITNSTPETAENIMYPKFNPRDPIPTELDIGPRAKYVEAYANSGKTSNSLIIGLSVLVGLLFVFIIILQLSKNN